MFLGRPFLFSAVGFLLILKIFADFFRTVLLVYKVGRRRFPFWRFPWVYLSLNFLYNLKFWLQSIPIDRRKPITFASFLSSLFLIWDFSSVISPGVCNRRLFCHRSCLALFTSKQSSPWTFLFGELKLYMFVKIKKKCQMFVYSGHALSYTKLVHRHATQIEGNKYFKWT